MQRLQLYLQSEQYIVNEAFRSENRNNNYCEYLIFIEDIIKYLKKDKESIKRHKNFLIFLNKFQANCEKFYVIVRNENGKNSFFRINEIIYMKSQSDLEAINI